MELEYKVLVAWAAVTGGQEREGRMIARGTWAAVKNEKPIQTIYAIMIKRHYGAC